MFMWVLSAIGEMVLSLMPDLADERTRKLLKQANYPSADDLAAFIGIKMCFVSVTLILGFISLSGNIIMLLLAVPISGLAWFVPNFYLAGRLKKNSEKPKS